MQPIKMEIEYSPNFRKQYKKLPQKVRQALKRRISLFLKDKSNPLLKNHQLSGKLKEYRSINITGDWRALYSEHKNGKVIIFEAVGTHSQLYK